MNPKWVPPYGNSYFDANGTVTGIITFSKKKKNCTGTWHVANDTLCVNWKKEKCRKVSHSGDGSYYLVNPNNGKRVVPVKKLTEGNQF